MIGTVDLPQVLASAVTYGAIYGLVALGYHLIFVSSGILNFALGEQLAVAGLLVLTLREVGAPPLVAIALAVLAAAGFGAAYERVALRPALRMGVVGPLIASVGVAIALGQGRVLLWGPEPESFPPFTGEPNASVSFLGGQWLVQSFWVLGTVGVAMVAVLLFLQHTRWGREWRATAQNPTGARLCGISPGLVATCSVAAASGLVTLAGIAIAPLVLAGGFYGLDFGVRGFAAAILGGFSSTTGVILGGFVVGLLDSYLVAQFSAEWADIVLYSLLVVGLLVRPRGLLGREAVTRA